MGLLDVESPALEYKSRTLVLYGALGRSVLHRALYRTHDAGFPCLLQSAGFSAFKAAAAGISERLESVVPQEKEMKFVCNITVCHSQKKSDTCTLQFDTLFTE